MTSVHNTNTTSYQHTPPNQISVFLAGEIFNAGGDSNSISGGSAQYFAKDQSNNHCSIQVITKFAFPFKLHAMLEDVVMTGEDHIVSCLPQGNAFLIHNPKEFAQSVMPKYFAKTKYRSFQRQLHIYDFKRTNSKSSRDNGAYSHALFLRGESEMCLQMTRRKIKGKNASQTDTRKHSNAGGQQELYSATDVPSQEGAVIKNSCHKRGRRSSLQKLLSAVAIKQEPASIPPPALLPPSVPMQPENVLGPLGNLINGVQAIMDSIITEEKSPRVSLTPTSPTIISSLVEKDERDVVWWKDKDLQDGEASSFSGKQFFLTTADLLDYQKISCEVLL